MALFSKNKSSSQAKAEGNSEEKEIKKELGISFSDTSGAETHKVLRSFYVSEKGSLASGMNQYVFKVFPRANKSEVSKEVAKLFNVKIKSVKILNMPSKRRDFGKHPGSKSGFKKALVVLKEGYTIGQAKP